MGLSAEIGKANVKFNVALRAYSKVPVASFESDPAPFFNTVSTGHAFSTSVLDAITGPISTNWISVLV